MEWFAPIDIYCERTGPEIWSEPLNAISNASFLLAAIWAYWTAKQRDVLNWTISSAIILVALISVGSFLFHTQANVWSELADVIPIWTFVVWFVILSIHYQTGRKNLKRTTGIVVGSIAFVGVIIWMIGSDVTTDPNIAEAGDGLNGSSQYAPAILALFVFAIIMQLKKSAGRWWVLAAAIAFTVSLTFRTVDLWVCPSLAIGTHFVWHLLNGLMIALLLQGLIRNVPITAHPQTIKLL